jgi:hypothetical protein
VRDAFGRDVVDCDTVDKDENEVEKDRYPHVKGNDADGKNTDAIEKDNTLHKDKM